MPHIERQPTDLSPVITSRYTSELIHQIKTHYIKHGTLPESVAVEVPPMHQHIESAVITAVEAVVGRLVRVMPRRTGNIFEFDMSAYRLPAVRITGVSD